MKFIHCADIHLDSSFSLSSPEESGKRRNELRSDFASLILLARSEGCGLFLISGDLFDDSCVTKDTFEMLFYEMSSLPSCKFFISPGNHDPYYEKSPYKLMNAPDNVHIFNSEKMEYVDIPEENIRVYGYAFTSDTYTSSPLLNFSVEDTSKINILVGHGDVCSGLSNYCPINEKEIAHSGFDYVALGHIHKASGLKYASEVPYCYPGCLEGRGFDETGYKGALLGEISKGSLDIKTVKISKRRYEIVNCDVTGMSSFSQALEKLMELCSGFGEDTALRVILDGITYPEFSADKDMLRSYITRPYYIELKDKTLPLYNADNLKNNKTIIGEFYRSLEPLISSEDYKTRETAILALKYGLKALYGKEI